MPRLEIIAISTHYSDDVLKTARLRGQLCELIVGMVFDLGDTEFRVGRAGDNELMLPLENVSRFHFRLLPRDQRFVYEDVGSRGTPIYNGKPLGNGISRVIEDGDTFNAAGIIFRYHLSLARRVTNGASGVAE